jgi:Fe2+ or Zn2+ uptake regulation protein
MRKPSIVGTAKEAALRVLNSSRKALSVDDIYVGLRKNEADRRSIPALYIALGQLCEAGFIALTEPLSSEEADLQRKQLSAVGTEDLPAGRSPRKVAHFILTDSGRSIVNALTVFWNIQSIVTGLVPLLNKEVNDGIVPRLNKILQQQKHIIDVIAGLSSPPSAPPFAPMSQPPPVRRVRNLAGHSRTLGAHRQGMATTSG